MSIVRSYTVRIYRCDICGWQDEWNMDWSSYGSIEMSETCPKDIPTMCSRKCREEFEARLADGRIKLPKLKTRGYHSVVLKPKFGYPLEKGYVEMDQKALDQARTLVQGLLEIRDPFIRVRAKDWLDRGAVSAKGES